MDYLQPVWIEALLLCVVFGVEENLFDFLSNLYWISTRAETPSSLVSL